MVWVVGQGPGGKGCKNGDEEVWSRYLWMDPWGIRCESLVSLVNEHRGASPTGGH